MTPSTHKANVPNSHLDSYITAIDLTANAELSNDSVTSLQRQIEIARQCNDASEFVKEARKIKDVPHELAEWFRQRYNSTGMLSIEKASEEFIQEVTR